MAEKLIGVVFLKDWRSYNKDEIAGFDEDTAEALVEAEVAEYQKAEKTADPAKTPPAGGKKQPAQE